VAQELEPGTHWLELGFYGLLFHEREASGSYHLGTVALSTTSVMPNALNDLVESAYTTGSYTLESFTAKPFNRPDLIQAAEQLEAHADMLRIRAEEQ
jgi:hypothetical protein